MVNLKRVETEGKIYITSDGISVSRKHDFRMEVRHGKKRS